MDEEDSGRVASPPGSREPTPSVSAASGFDPSRGGPKRGHDLIVRIGADNARALADSLRCLANDVDQGRLTSGCSGSPSAGFIYSYRHNPEMTHDRYFQEIDEWLATESPPSITE